MDFREGYWEGWVEVGKGKCFCVVWSVSSIELFGNDFLFIDRWFLCVLRGIVFFWEGVRIRVINGSG